MYHFDEIIDRQGTNALNTDGFRGYIFHAGPEKQFPYKDEEFVRMWVADMEFSVAPEILEALHERVDRRIFGYTTMSDDSYFQAFQNWCRTQYGWEPEKNELCITTGIVPSLYQLIEILCAPDEKVLFTTPSYGPFLQAAQYSNAGALTSPLRKDSDSRFHVDFEQFESQCADPKCKAVIWCNPHNPTGRVWTTDELQRVAAIVQKYNLWIISDEIHCDLTRKTSRFTPMAMILPEYPKLITCMAPTKTFNLAGLAFSNTLIRDRETRERFRARDKSFGLINPLSLTAARCAYEKGGRWHNELRDYLDENFSFVKQFIDEQIPGAVMNISEATYLAWVDLNRVLPDVEDLPDFFANEAGVLLEGGDRLFVENAKGFIRLNLAMPRSIIQTGLERMRDAIQKHSIDGNLSAKKKPADSHQKTNCR